MTHIGKYEILSELGRGGMGVVYLAEDKNIGREVAVKTLTEASPELRQRFLIEARSGALNHPNIVTIYDFGEQDGVPYIVMEYLRGESLDKVLSRPRPLVMVEKLEIVRQVCEGLAYAHSQGVVHRDIKPGNIMVLPGGQVKIFDFGIARLESTGSETKGWVIGTLHYLSPERLRGDPSDGRADIWAVGVVLYFILTGVQPFAGNDIEALYKAINEPYPPLADYLTEYPAALDQILERALAKNPDDRYAHADQMASDIEAVNDVLKRARVDEMLTRVRGLLESGMLTAARPILLELERLDSRNVNVKRLLRELQEQLSSQQRSEPVRQMLSLAEEAVHTGQYAEALDLYTQATKIDPSIAGLQEKIHDVQALKVKADRVTALLQQAHELSNRNDFTAALHLINQPLQLDERNTTLLNEQVAQLQKLKLMAEEGLRNKLKETGRESLEAGSFTQLFQSLEVKSTPKQHSPKSSSPAPLTNSRTEPKPSIFDTTMLSRTSFFEGDHVRYTKIQETLEFYRDRLSGEYQALSNQARLTYYLWIASVILGLASLVAGIVLLFLKQFTSGSITTISTAFVYFVQKIFQQREDYYRSLATAKHEHLEDGNRWLLAIQTIDSIEDSRERLRRQGQLADILNKKLAPPAARRSVRRVTPKSKSANV